MSPDFWTARTGSPVRVKICGVTRPEDAEDAVRCGADAIGLVFAAGRRQVDLTVALSIVGRVPSTVTIVGVFRNQEVEFIQEVLAGCPLSVLQFHGEETPDFCARFDRPIIRAFPLIDRAGLERALEFGRICPGAALLADGAAGGTGSRCDWPLAAELAARTPLILAGGLTPENVALAVATVRPGAVDVSSGVESAPGIKDAGRIAAFVRNARPGS
ncbi:MAG: phosphoribosylanthranilate isomerase [Candidatus Riflebacteria bacterium]|nr:phosphoribosylanthranilate isomerase [Candidatus Riflebacteria bacterium]